MCQDSAEFKYSVPTTLHAALLAWQQAEMQRPAAICFKVEPFLPSGLSPLLQLHGKTLPEAQKVQ